MSLADRYLARLGVERPAKLDLATLQSLLEAHLRAIPFENLTSFTGSPVSLVPEEIFAKLLEGKRGGYCMEHCLLSSHALRALGFDARPNLARVYDDPTRDGPPPQHHAMTVVSIDGAQYLFDPGFGSTSPTIPIRLNFFGEQAGEYGTYRLRCATDLGEKLGPHFVGPDVTAVLESYVGDTWTPMYGLTPPPVVLSDMASFNWFVCTSPTSIFTRTLMGCRWDGHTRVTLSNRAFKRRAPEGTVEVEVASVEDVERWLRREMRLGVDNVLVAAVWRRLSEM